MPGFSFAFDLQGRRDEFDAALSSALGSLVHLPNYSSTTLLSDPHCFLGCTFYPDYPINSYEFADHIVHFEGRLYGTAQANLQSKLKELVALAFRYDELASPEDEAWVQAGGRTFRTVRGLPPTDEPPVPVPFYSATYRRPLCATGECTANEEQAVQYREALEYIGFRCARRATR